MTRLPPRQQPLTPRQAELMEALIATGSLKGVSRTLGVSIETVKSQLKRIRAAMGMTGVAIVPLAIAFDRAKRVEQKSSP